MKFKKSLSVVAGIGAIVAALAVVDYLEPEPMTIKDKPAAKAPVSVVNVTPKEHGLDLVLLATTAARWPIQLKASSTAQLAWLNPKIEPGVIVQKGTSLAKLDTSALESNLAQAKSEVRQAELSLQQAQHEQTVALKMLSPNTSSSFARREPQVSAAKADLERANQAYASAEKLLKEANIVAPFNAVIIRRAVSPGEWLETGQVAFELAASDSLDVELPVSDLNWSRVQKALATPNIYILNRTGNKWPAQVRYVSPQADMNTRQRQVVLSVHQPYEGKASLLPNQQVKVVVSLGKQPQIATLPLSSLTRDGFVWTLDEESRLQKEWVALMGQEQDKVHVRFHKHSSNARQVVVYPLMSMLAGKVVFPQSEQGLIAKQRAE